MWKMRKDHAKDFIERGPMPWRGSKSREVSKEKGDCAWHERLRGPSGPDKKRWGAAIR